MTNDLTQNEQDILLAKLHHAMKNSPVCLDAIYEVIGLGESLGIYEGVKFGHQEVYPNPNTKAVTA